MDSLGLTKRQQEILELVSKGCSNGDIAELLEISPNTVKTHVATILERLDVTNRTEASVFFQKQNDSTQPADVPLSFSTIDIHFTCDTKSSDVSQLAENLTKLLNCYEVLKVDYYFEQENESPQSYQGYSVKVELNPQDNSTAQLTLFHLDENQNYSLLEKVDHPLKSLSADALMKHAVQFYRCALQHYVNQLGSKEATVSDDLLKAILLSESVSYEHQSKALQLCENIIARAPDWHLPYALKSALIYRMMVIGLLPGTEEQAMDMARAAKQAFSLNSSSSWSQLAFAHFAMLSSDLVLAKTHLKAALQENPCQYRALHMLAQVIALEGDIKQSISIYQEVLEKFPRSETDGMCYGAMSLLYYCARDFENSKTSALRALMYDDGPAIPMLLNLISIAEIEQNNKDLERFLGQLQGIGATKEIISGSLKVATRIVPAELMQPYVESLRRAGLDV